MTIENFKSIVQSNSAASRGSSQAAHRSSPRYGVGDRVGRYTLKGDCIRHLYRYECGPNAISRWTSQEYDVDGCSKEWVK